MKQRIRCFKYPVVPTRNIWLRGKRTKKDMLKYWMGHKPHDVSGLFSQLREELEMRLEEADRVGYGIDIPSIVIVPIVPIVPKKVGVKLGAEVAA